MNPPSSAVGRLARGLGALVVLAALVVAVPWALVHFVGAPWPSQVPTVAQTRLSIRQTGVSTATLIKLVSVVVWIAWLRLVVAGFIELVAVVGDRPTPQLRMLGVSQRLIGGLFAAVLAMFGGMQSAMAVTTTAIAPRAAATVVAPVAPVASTVASTDVVGSRLAPLSHHSSAGTHASARTHSAAPHDVAISGHASTGAVTPDLGAGRSTVAGPRVPTGTPTGASGTASVGGGRHTYSTAERSATPEVATPPTTWIVQRNDSFWRIADAHLGDGTRWREVVEANVGREVAPGVFFDRATEAIHPGWVLALPAADGSPIRATPPPAAAGSTAPVAAVPTASSVTVERGDTLASIADDAYGDSAEWDSVWEANRGRRFGDRTFDDPNLILPGWTLAVPDDPGAPLVIASTVPAPTATPGGADPTVTASAPANTASTGPASTIVDPASCLPDLSPITPGAHTSPSPTAPNSASAAERSGAGAVRPTSVDRPAGPAAMSLAVTFDPASAVPSADQSADQSLVNPTADHRGVLSPVGLAAATGIAGAVVGLVGARRRAAMRRARAGARVAGLTDPMIRLERELRHVAEQERIARLDLAVRAAHEQFDSPGRLIGAFVHPDGRIELVLDQVEGTPGAPFVVSTPGRWELPAEVAIEHIELRHRFAAFACPALIHLGRLADRPEVAVHLDLEAVGLLQVTGAPAAMTAGIVRAAAVGLTVSLFAEQARVITCGVPLPAINGANQATEVGSADEAIDLAADLVGPILGSLRTGQTTAQLRRASAGEAWEPALVVLAASVIDDSLAGGLPDLCRPAGRGLAVVTDAPKVAAEATLRAGADGWVLTPLGVTIEPIGFSADDAEALAALVEAAGTLSEPPRRPLAAVGAPGDAPSAWQMPEWTLMARVLGPLDVIDRQGRPVEFERSKALELVAWLVEHRTSATRRGARAALWETDVQDATFANVVSDARRNLARLVAPPTGEEWLGRSLSESLTIHPEVVGDLDVLRCAVTAARALPPRPALVALQSALALVRDAPFAASTAIWPDAEGVVSQAMLTVTEAATAAAEICLTVGDLPGLFEATGKGLLAVPGHEELIALRMRAYASTGDLASVRVEWAGYERVLTADRWSSGEPAPKLAALRRELLGTRLAA